MAKKKKKKNNNKDTIIKDIKVDKTDIKTSEAESKVNSNKISPVKRKNSLFLDFLILLVLISSLAYFTCSLLKFNSLGDVVNGLLMLGISILFIAASTTNPSKNKTTSYLALVILFGYQVVGCLTSFEIITWPNNEVDNFVGRSLTEVVEWSTNNNVKITQEYEYSDMIKEYHVIGQNVLPGTKLNKIKSLTVSISEGPSPYKDIVLPNMIGWDTDRVLDFIKKNYLTNVNVEFVQGSENENTLIEQSKSGNVKRNDEIKFTFSFGDERHYSEVKLIDLVNKSKFEAEFYLKQHGIKYEFDYDFSDKIKRGNVVKQDVKAGTMVPITGEDIKTVKVTISKGPKIVIPDLKKMSVIDITNWVIKNKLKIEFKDQYDDSVKENNVLNVNYKKDDVVEEGTVIVVTLSKGKLVMESFSSYAQFREWADKYGVTYEEQHEFSNDVPVGEVIKYSYDVGSTIKNNDVVIVTISDGKRIEVPNLKGLTKNQAIDKLEKASLNYSFVYKYSDTVASGKVISQSISAGSEVSQGTTVTVTISNGVKPPTNSGSDGGANSESNNPPTPTCTPKTYTIGRNLNNIFANYSGFETVKSQLYSFFAANYSDVKINVVGVDGGDATSGSYIGGIGPGSSITSCNSSAYTIQIAK